MPLTLILGPANSAKAGEVLGAYVNATAGGRDGLLVVPTAADAAHYDRELAAGGHTLSRALTFAGLIVEIARRAGVTSVALTSLQREQLLRRTIAALELPALGASARAAGFPAAAGRLVGELAQARIGAPRFAAAVRTWGAHEADEVDDAEGTGRRGAYARDLGALVLGYAHALERAGRVDEERFATLALDALRAAPRRWNGTAVSFYGFDDLTALQRDAIETLARVIDAPVTVSLTFEPGRRALAARSQITAELSAYAAAVRELPPLDDHYEPGARTDLHHLERYLFEPGAEPLDPGDAVVLMEAGGERAEAELIAAEVLAARREGVAPEEIVVVCRSLQRSGALLEGALARYGVAAASERRVPLGHTALGRGLLALGRCALLDGGPAADLVTYLRTPGVSEAQEQVDELDARIRRTALRTAAEAARSFAVPEIEALRNAADLGAALADAARRLLAAPNRRAAPVLDPPARRDARAAAAVIAAIGELREAGESVTGLELLTLLEGLEVAAGDPPGPEHVLIAEPLAIRARRFRRVFVSGLCEGEFPAPGGADPFLGEDRRRELALVSGLVLAPEPDPLARERYLLYACVSRATERLVLSYRSSDEDGNLVLPSPFLADIAELFVPEWRARRRRRLLADVVWSPAEAPTVREHALAEVEAAPAGAAEEGAGTRRLGTAAMGHVRHREVVSGGALEAFASCPVKWLVESQLAPRELAPDSDALARGSFMHEVLERVIAALGGPVTPASLPEAERLLGETVSDPPGDLAPGRPPQVRVAILRGIEADLLRYLRHEAGDGNEWVPRSLELRFGFDEDESLPGLVLGAGEDAVHVRGVIDRVDVAPGAGGGVAPSGGAGARVRAIVRDYKSGANRAERAGARWRDEHQLQVGLYMIAVRRLLALDPVAGFYQPLTGRDLRPRGAFEAGTEVGRAAFTTDGLAPEELDDLLAEIEAQAVEIAATLRRGELTPAPETCGRDGCRHPGICWA